MSIQIWAAHESPLGQLSAVCFDRCNGYRPQTTRFSTCTKLCESCKNQDQLVLYASLAVRRALHQVLLFGASKGRQRKKGIMLSNKDNLRPFFQKSPKNANQWISCCETRHSKKSSAISDLFQHLHHKHHKSSRPLVKGLYFALKLNYCHYSTVQRSRVCTGGYCSWRSSCNHFLSWTERTFEIMKNTALSHSIPSRSNWRNSRLRLNIASLKCPRKSWH